MSKIARRLNSCAVCLQEGEVSAARVVVDEELDGAGTVRQVITGDREGDESPSKGVIENIRRRLTLPEQGFVREVVERPLAGGGLVDRRGLAWASQQADRKVRLLE